MSTPIISYLIRIPFRRVPIDVCKALSKVYNAFHLIEFLFDVDVAGLESNDATESSEEDEEKEDRTVSSEEDEDEEEDQMNENVPNLSSQTSGVSYLSHQSDVTPTATSNRAVHQASYVYNDERIDVIEAVVKGITIMRRIDNNYMNLTSILKLVGFRLNRESHIYQKILKKKIAVLGGRMRGTW